MRKLLLYLFLYGVAAFLLFHNLSDRLLWADEAETAVLAKNIIQFGVPLANDGKNFLAIFPPEHVEVNEKFVWTWNPWLAPYIAATSFKVFGPTTFAARIPFVLVAFATILLIRKVVITLYGDEETAAIATLLLAVSVPFLLHSRQCRYYAILSFSQLWILLGYHKMHSEESRSGGIPLTLGMIAQFYSNYIAFAGNCVALGIHVLFSGPKKKELILRLAPCAAVSAAATLPWVIYSGVLGQSRFMSISRVWRALAFYISETNLHIVPLLILFLPLLIFARRYLANEETRWRPETSLVIIFVVGQLAMLAFFYQIYFRYLMTPLPLLIILEARALTWSFTRRWVRYIVLSLLVLTNWLGIIPLLPFRVEHKPGFPLIHYAQEIASDYEDKLENVVDFFLVHGNPSESIFVMDVEAPLIFYTEMQIVDGRFPENTGKLTQTDWILTDSPSSVIYYPPWVLNISPSDLPGHEAIRLKVRNTAHGASRPDPNEHRAFTAQSFKDITIFRRKF